MQRARILVLTSKPGSHSQIRDPLSHSTDFVEFTDIDAAVNALRHDQFDAIISDVGDFLPLERALVSQQASLILDTIGEGICIVDGEGLCSWSNKRMRTWPPHVHERVRRSCLEAFELFAKQVSPIASDAPAFARCKRFALNIDDAQYFEMIASPVMSQAGQVMQVVAVVWDATSSRRLQQKIDAIDKAGRELVKLDSETLIELDVMERLKLLEEKVITFTHDLLHFDNFAIRLLERDSNKLELVISVGLPSDANEIELLAEPEGNGISGYVAATGRSYICPDVARDTRYVQGLDNASSSLTVPLRLHDRVIGIFNVESRQKAAFNEDDRQFAEIFGRYVALALNILDLLVVERAEVRNNVADLVCTEAAGPLNDIMLDCQGLLDGPLSDEVHEKLSAVMRNAQSIKRCLEQAQAGVSTVFGADKVMEEADPALSRSSILVADDDRMIRDTIVGVLRKFGANVTTASDGGEACRLVEKEHFDAVLSDIRMPDKTGYEIYAAARHRLPGCPVILMTGFGYDPTHSIVRASQEGLEAVLYKPFKVDQLLAVLRKALASKVEA